MSSLSDRISRFVQLGILVIGFASCRTDLGPHEATVLRAPGAGPEAMSSGPSPLTVVSRDNGRTYTLDVTAQKVRVSTGEVMALTLSQTNDMYAAFKRIIATDPVADTLGSLTYGDTTICHPKCITQYSLPKKGSQTLGGFQASNTSSLQPTGTLTLNFSESATTSSLITQDAMFGDPCTDIVTSAALAKLNYKGRRTRILDEALSIGAGEGANAYGEYVFPPGTLAAAELMTLMVENLTTSVQVNIMAFYWNSYSCGSRQITSAPIYHSAPSGYGTGGWSCITEPALISFNGGSWSQVWVQICNEQTQ